MNTDILGQCAYCPRLCQDVCPAVRGERRETVSPTSIMTALLLEREGRLEGDAALWELVTHCVVCERCTAACLHNATPWDTFLSARRRLSKHASRGLDAADLWRPAPFLECGQGDELWLLLGSLQGLAIADVETLLAQDTQRLWRLPEAGLPHQLYTAWALGDEATFAAYADALREELKLLQVAGVAWSDPHEGKAVEALLDAIRFHHSRGYAPVLLGHVPAAQTGCGDLTQRWGCCGGAGGYPDADPAAAAELARNYAGDPRQALPGICIAHLRRYGRNEFRSDWSRV